MGSIYDRGSIIQSGGEGIVIHLRNNRIMGCYYDRKREKSVIWLCGGLFYYEDKFNTIDTSYLPMFITALKEYVRVVYEGNKE